MNSYDIQRLLSSPDKDGTVMLPSGEFEGPFVINKCCRIIGANTTLWGGKGPVLTVKDKGTKLENLRVEITNENLPANEYVAIYSKVGDTEFENVEIIGRLFGISGESEPWGIPKLISLGQIPAEKECIFSMNISVPIAAELVPTIHDITLSPYRLEAGINRVEMKIQPIRSGSFIYGEILLKSAVTRRIYVSGSAVDDAANYTDGQLVFDADIAELEKQRENFAQEIIYPEAETSLPDTNELYKPEISHLGDDNAPAEYSISRGMHVPLNDDKIEIELVYENKDFAVDVDAFAFMANENGDIISNDRFVFFGNDHSACGTLRFLNAPDRKIMYLRLKNVPYDVKQIDFAYSIYENDKKLDFRNLVKPSIEIRFSDGRIVKYYLEPPLEADTILGVGLEFNGNCWELSPYGMIYKKGLTRLCENYGLVISN